MSQRDQEAAARELMFQFRDHGLDEDTLFESLQELGMTEEEAATWTAMAADPGDDELEV